MLFQLQKYMVDLLENVDANASGRIGEEPIGEGLVPSLEHTADGVHGAAVNRSRIVPGKLDYNG
jgi:hypothetical protein